MVHIIPSKMSPELLSAIQSVRFIAQHIKDADKDNEVGVQSLSLMIHCKDMYSFYYSLNLFILSSFDEKT